MNNKSKKWRSAIAMVLVVCMLFSIFPTAAFATEPKKQYVSLGDSMTNGLGLENYDNYGYLAEPVGSYPVLLESKYNWDLTQLAISSLRAEDVLNLLTFTGENGAIEGDLYWEEIVNTTCENSDRVSQAVGVVAANYQQAVNNADVISLQLGNNNFTTFMTQKLKYELSVLTDGALNLGVGNEYANAITSADIAERVALLSPEAAEYVDEVYAMLMAALTTNAPMDEKMISFCNEMALFGTYSFASYMVGYKGVMDYIVANNADAELIIVGLPNALYGFGIDVNSDGSADIDLGQFFDVLVNAANLYVVGLAATYSDLDIVYAEADSAEIEQFYNTEAMQNPASNDKVRKGMIATVCGMIFPMLNGVVSDGIDAMVKAVIPTEYIDYFNVSVELPMLNLDVVNGDYSSIGEATVNINFAEGLPVVAENLVRTTINEAVDSTMIYGKAVEIYLAFETAIANAATMKVVDLNAVMALTGGLDAIFATIDVNDLENSLLDNDSIMSLMHLVGRFIVGDGIGCHPTADGHAAIYEAIVAAYDNGYTPKDQVAVEAQKAVDLIVKLIDENKEEIYAVGYDLAKPYLDVAVIELYKLNVALGQIDVNEITDISNDMRTKLDNAIIEAQKDVQNLISFITEEASTLDDFQNYIPNCVTEIANDIQAINTICTQAGIDAYNQLGTVYAEVGNAIIAVQNALYAATHGDYVVSEDSYYVSLGDSTVTGMGANYGANPAGYDNFGYKTVVPASFPYKLAEKLGLDVTNQYIQLALAGLRTTDLRYILDETFVPDEYAIERNEAGRIDVYAGGLEKMREDYNEALAKADLVTISFGNCNFTDFAGSQLTGMVAEVIRNDAEVKTVLNSALGDTIKNGLKEIGLDVSSQTYDLKWENYLDAEAINIKNEALAGIKAALVENGMDIYPLDVASMLDLEGVLNLVVEIPVADLICEVLDLYLYAYVTYAADYAEVLDLIHEKAPNAEVMVLGLCNPTENLVLNIDGTNLAVGEYLGAFLQFVNAHYFAYALANGSNTTYVDVYGAESVFEAQIANGNEFELMDYITSFAGENSANYHATIAGHTYMAEQAYAALNVIAEDNSDVEVTNPIDVLIAPNNIELTAGTRTEIVLKIKTINECQTFWSSENNNWDVVTDIIVTDDCWYDENGYYCTKVKVVGGIAGSAKLRATVTDVYGNMDFEECIVTVTAASAPEPEVAVLDSISVNSTGHKTAYKVGDALDVANLTVLATYSDASTETVTVTAGMVSGFDTATTGNKTVTITYGGKTTTFTINVTAKSSGISFGGGGGGGFASANVSIDAVKHLDVKVSTKYASTGETVTITVDAANGYYPVPVEVFDSNGNNVVVTRVALDKWEFVKPAGNVKVSVTEKAYAKELSLYIDNKVVVVNDAAFMNDVAPFISNDRTMVPIRIIVEQLGGIVDWDDATRTVMLTIDGKVLTMVIDKIIPGFDAAATIVDDRTYVPIRYVMEAVGANVDWIEDTRQVVIVK